MTEIISSEALTALFQVVMIDLVLAGDNAIVIGLAAAGLARGSAQQGDPDRHHWPPRSCGSASPASRFNCCRSSGCCSPAAFCCSGCAGRCGANCARRIIKPKCRVARRQARWMRQPAGAPRKTLGQAVWQITIADVSMSLDNVLAVAGAAREHPLILIFGLALSIALMGVRRQLHCAPAGKAPLDRLCRPPDHSLCGFRHVLPRRAGGVATPQRRSPPQRCLPTIKRALIGIGESAPIRDSSVACGESHGCHHFDCR